MSDAKLLYCPNAKEYPGPSPLFSGDQAPLSPMLTATFNGANDISYGYNDTGARGVHWWWYFQHRNLVSPVCLSRQSRPLWGGKKFGGNPFSSLTRASISVAPPPELAARAGRFSPLGPIPVPVAYLSPGMPRNATSSGAMVTPVASPHQTEIGFLCTRPTFSGPFLLQLRDGTERRPSTTHGRLRDNRDESPQYFCCRR